MSQEDTNCLKDIKDGLVDIAQQVLNIPSTMVQIFDAVAECLKLLLWLREQLKSMCVKHFSQNL